MNLRRLFITSLGCLALFFAACSRPQIEVVDSAGAPIEGAEIVGYSLSIQGQQTQTDKRGHAQIPSAVQQTQWIVVSKPGFIRTEQIDVSGPKPIKVILQKK